MSTINAPPTPPAGSSIRRAAAVVSAPPPPPPPPPLPGRVAAVPPPVPAAGDVWTARRAPVAAPAAVPTLVPVPRPVPAAGPIDVDPGTPGGSATTTCDEAVVGSSSLAARLLLVGRFASLVYVFVTVFLVLAAVVPALVAGWQPLAVTSGSMQPAVAPGSVVMVEPSEPEGYYAHPTIVAFPDVNRPDRLLTHRVVETTSEDGAVIYTTKGDANRVADSDPLAHDDAIGAVRMVVPFAGLPAAWFHTGAFVHLALWALASIAAVGALLVRVRP